MTSFRLLVVHTFLLQNQIKFSIIKRLRKKKIDIQNKKQKNLIQKKFNIFQELCKKKFISQEKKQKQIKQQIHNKNRFYRIFTQKLFSDFQQSKHFFSQIFYIQNQFLINSLNLKFFEKKIKKIIINKKKQIYFQKKSFNNNNKNTNFKIYLFTHLNFHCFVCLLLKYICTVKKQKQKQNNCSCLYVCAIYIQLFQLICLCINISLYIQFYRIQQNNNNKIYEIQYIL
ncbi:hypothetical protein PPERSA_10123 [Pseudocohnilembus persalinus]|uniref:Transmembrane protein n=1 Tax=Pseudocohnilembus persalinus TaxID=266149 RepID=A0A0V0QZV2_PSEPJ|nr:hypothetical protein PPERSA_10123 [Pseudocohnilembus persalinus]|eukprot:KRX07839.1 hypothetical protein PPERSA_10123 [Pseudocohnilembus persalinus]